MVEVFCYINTTSWWAQCSPQGSKSSLWCIVPGSVSFPFGLYHLSQSGCGAISLLSGCFEPGSNQVALLDLMHFWCLHTASLECYCPLYGSRSATQKWRDLRIGKHSLTLQGWEAKRVALLFAGTGSGLAGCRSIGWQKDVYISLGRMLTANPNS